MAASSFGSDTPVGGGAGGKVWPGTAVGVVKKGNWRGRRGVCGNLGYSYVP